MQPHKAVGGAHCQIDLAGVEHMLQPQGSIRKAQIPDLPYRPVLKMVRQRKAPIDVAVGVFQAEKLLAGEQMHDSRSTPSGEIEYRSGCRLRVVDVLRLQGAAADQQTEQSAPHVLNSR